MSARTIDPYQILVRRVAGQTWTMIGESFGVSPGAARRAMVPVCEDTSNVGIVVLRAAITQAVNSKVCEVVMAIVDLDALDVQADVTAVAS